MNQKRRIGIVGFGHLGQYLFGNLPKEDFEIVFVWNRTKDSLVGKIPDDLILDSLDDFEERKADLIVEVAHPDVTRKLGVKFVSSADYMVGSPTALSDSKLMEEMKEAATRGHNGVYVPSGALWGGKDIQKMDQLGTIQDFIPKDEEEDKGRLKSSSNWRRHRMTHEIVQELEAEYLQQPKPCRTEIEKMAARFGQRENNIYAWFYRRRNRDQREGNVKLTDDEVEPTTFKRTAPSSPSPSSVKVARRRRNSRTSRFFTKEEQTVLENVFARQNHPGESEIEGLARWFQKDEKKISAWFARRRMKFTKDFVKKIDADKYVPETCLEDDVKLNLADTPQPPRYIPRLKEAKPRRDLDETDDEECDVVCVSPLPESDGSTLSCVTCGVSKLEPDEVSNEQRETVIQWYSKPKESEPDNHRASSGNRVANPCSLTNAFESKTEVGLPKLVPIEWVLGYPHYFPFNRGLGPQMNYGGHQWCLDPDTGTPVIIAPRYPHMHDERYPFSFDELKTVNKKE